MKIAIIGGLILALLGGTGLIDSLSVLGDSVGLVGSLITWFVNNLVWIVLIVFVSFLLYFIFVVRKQEKKGGKK